ncbi:hypothetical protein BU17DRAFT_59795 [Hysterangium stoloniferum]|nr:hypothetical protein BU17DRAFT_59795 [Hysterangium stoloniferum]
MSDYYSITTLGLFLLASFGCIFANASDRVTNNTYVRVIYDTKPQSTVYYDFDECYPYVVNGARALNAVWLKSTSCLGYTGPNCNGDIFPPLPVPVPGGTVLVNAADFVELIEQSAMCSEDKDLPSITPLTDNGL